jgi:hypothetical protein
LIEELDILMTYKAALEFYQQEEYFAERALNASRERIVHCRQEIAKLEDTLHEMERLHNGDFSQEASECALTNERGREDTFSRD